MRIKQRWPKSESRLSVSKCSIGNTWTSHDEHFFLIAMVGRLQEKDVHTKIKQLYELCPGLDLECCSEVGLIRFSWCL